MDKVIVKVVSGVFVVLSVLMALIAVSSLMTTDDPLPHDAQVLVSTFGVGMALFGIAVTLTGFRRREAWAWITLWYYPIFFVIHVFALGTAMPDGAFAVLSAGALLLALPAVMIRQRAAAVPSRA